MTLVVFGYLDFGFVSKWHRQDDLSAHGKHEP
jgi:hypothetical protein